MRDKHGVAVTVKTVFLLHRVTVGIQHILRSTEGAYQHQQRGFRQMKIGQQGVCDPELKSRKYENIRLALKRYYAIILR